MDIPWKENATLVRMAGTSTTGDEEDVQILFEGPLSAMVARVRGMSPLERKRLRISLPDRNARPNSFQNEAITMLMDKLPRAQI